MDRTGGGLSVWKIAAGVCLGIVAAVVAFWVLNAGLFVGAGALTKVANSAADRMERERKIIEAKASTACARLVRERTTSQETVIADMETMTFQISGDDVTVRGYANIYGKPRNSKRDFKCSVQMKDGAAEATDLWMR